jgi:transcriptional regulator with XRE-family HTH domain
MASSFKAFRARALSRPDVRKAYDALGEEFSFLDEVLKARAAAGLTQAEVAARVGTTQSAIARLESGAARHSPSISTLQRYANALGCRLEVRFVKDRRLARNSRWQPRARRAAANPLRSPAGRVMGEVKR